MTDTLHQDVIQRIARDEFGAEPELITRMTNGICNEVYTVAVRGREYIFRLNAEPRFMLGSHNHIPLFKSKGIRVPEILAEDLTKNVVPIAWQIQSKLPGRDINEVIATLTDDELTAIGSEIANVFRQLHDVPNSGKFGVLWGDGRDLVDSWSAEVDRVIEVVIGWGRSSGVLDAKLERVLRWISEEYKPYFNRIRPYTYFGDIAGKNVMVNDGRFSGLVDLDALAQGDPLEAIGRIKASWYGTHHGEIYSNSVMDELGLHAEQRKIVTMYALLNRAFWTLENGHRFNRNTTSVIDREREINDKQAVDRLWADLHGETRPVELKSTAPEPAAAILPVPVLAETPRRPGRPRKVPLPEPDAAQESQPEAIPKQPVQPTHVQEIEPVQTNTVTPPEPGPMPMISKPVGEPDQVLPEFELTGVFADFEPVSQAVHAAVPTPSVSSQKVALEASGLSKTYTSDGVGFNALKNVDLRIQQGDCIAIVGKSGSGKSTLMHLLACLDAPTEGYVYVDGDETSTMSEPEKNRLRNEKFGFVFQQFFLNGRETVFENVVLPLRIRGASDFDMITDADEALAAVGLTDKSEKKAKDLSGGEKQRVCIARALVGRPQVIFADEPTGNLDSNTGAAVENMLFDLNRNKGITLVIVTHDPDLAKRCRRIVEMKDGQIVGEYRGEASI